VTSYKNTAAVMVKTPKEITPEAGASGAERED